MPAVTPVETPAAAELREFYERSERNRSDAPCIMSFVMIDARGSN